MTLPLETGILYGPLFSRRLGLSLGVNVLPTAYKICIFDCIYCHYGRTDVTTLARQDDFPETDKVVKAVEQALHSAQRFNSLTFSGNGEPTLHPDFSDIVIQVKQMRDRLRPEVALSLYSNASTVVQSRIRESLRCFDNPILKLDAGDQQIFEQVNRPSGVIKLEDIITGMKSVPNLIIQSLLVGGPVNNSDARAIQTWQATLAEIRPVKVQLYSCDYPVPVHGVTRVLPYVLKQIARETESRTGISVLPYWIA